MFSVGDKVFAKVRGYPAWPARVDAVADATPNKTKYHIFFYGTLETAVCKAEDLYPYAENKENYGRPSKRKYFNEGLAQIEGLVPVPEPVRGTIVNNDSDSEGNLIIDTHVKPGKTSKRKRDCGSISDEADDKEKSFTGLVGHVKRRRVSGQIQKRTKKESCTTTGTPDTKNDDILKPEVISRSGRVIKPKRFADDTLDHSSPDKISNTEDGFIQNIDEDNSNSIILKDTLEYPVKSKELPEELIKTFSSGVSKILNEKGISTYEQFMKRIKEKRKKKLAWLKIELRLMELEMHIRSKLSLDKSEPGKCLQLFDELFELGLEPLMLKKHPEVIDTIDKIKKYTGNITSQISKEEEIEYNDACDKLRQKAKLLIDKFANILNIPDGCDFKDFFCKCVSDLRERTKDLSKNKFYSLTIDPTLRCEIN